MKNVWFDFCFRYATIKTLKDKYRKSEKWVRNQLMRYAVSDKATLPREMVAIMDATRIGKWWYFVVRDPHGKENVYMAETYSESTFCYQAAIKDLSERGFIIKAVVVDGKVALSSWIFGNLPIQMCHFHQKQIVVRYITMNPILDAGKELLALTNTLSITNEKEFTLAFKNWSDKWKTFLSEKTVSENGRSFYTHRNLRSARDSIKRHLPYLFTFERFPELNIPNTTNSLDGSFTKLKNSIAVHAGLSQKLKMKMVKTILQGEE